ncbi:MFS transporter [uncultured Bacteroides sp.]|uniref:MFS transporter n=1 Tax=uncultured Bacteroides sp. TaxID=162156 RepID=UPI00261BBAB8|nr:MFS transporter [uncultured Bacteroides sp.]
MDQQPIPNKEQVTGDLNWDGLTRPKIYYAMFATFCGLFLSVIDGTICNVALPTIAHDLNVPSSDSIWVVNGFQLVIMMTLLPFSSLGEIYGYKRVYVCGVVVFTVGSFCSAMSQDFLMLVASRAFQGLGASMIMSVNTSLIKLIYPKKELGKGIGLNATVVALAAVAGPTIAAGILSLGNWRWLFLVNIPVGTLTFFMARKFLPKNPVKIVGDRFNWREAILNAATFGLLIGCIEAFSHSFPPELIAVAFGLFIVIGTLYVRMQLHKEYPMLPFDLLRIPVFTMSIVTSIFSFTAQMLAMVSLPFMLDSVFHYTAVETGLLMTAWPFVIVFVAPLVGSLIGKLPPGILSSIGLLIMSIGCFSLAFVPDDVTHIGFIWRLMLCGMGFGFFQSPNNHIMLASAPEQRAGSASGMLATARLLGQTIGAALVALFFHLYGEAGSHDAFLLAGILMIVGAVASSLRMKQKVPSDSGANG